MTLQEKLLQYNQTYNDAMSEIDTNYQTLVSAITSLKNQLKLEQSMCTPSEWAEFIRAEKKVLDALASVYETRKKCVTTIRDYSLKLLDKSREEIDRLDPEKMIDLINRGFEQQFALQSELLRVARDNYTQIANRLAEKISNKPVRTETPRASDPAKLERINHASATQQKLRAQTNNASFMLKLMSTPSKMNVCLIFFGVLFLASGAVCIGIGLGIPVGVSLLASGLFAVGVGYKNHSDIQKAPSLNKQSS